MFVRKGTVRKNRGGANNRRSVRRPRRDSNGTGAPKKYIASDEPSSSSVSRRATPNEEHAPVGCSSTIALAREEDIHTSIPMTPVKCRTNGSVTHVPSCSNDVRYQTDIVKPSPSKSQCTTVVVSLLLSVCLCSPSMQLFEA